MEMSTWKSRLCRWAPWVILVGLFLAFGIWVRFQMPVPIGAQRDTEIYSFDYLGYADTLCDFRFIAYGRFRHPLWGWLMSPVTLLGHRLYAINEWTFWVFILLMFSIVMAGCVALVHRLLTRVLGLSLMEALAATFLFISFAHVWLLGGMPETYGVSMLLALATLSWGAGSRERCAADAVTLFGEKVCSKGIGRRLDSWVWGLLAVLSGGVTITQMAKTALAFWTTHRLSRRQIVLGAIGLGSVVSIVVLIFYVRVRMRVAAGMTTAGMEQAWHTLADNFAPGSLPWTERLRYMWVFFSEPILVRGEPFDERMITGGYPSLLHVALLLALYGVVVASAWLNRRHVLVKMIGAMFLVDVGIHFVAGWGLMESHLYAGHWFYALPILAGMLFGRLSPRGRRRYACLLGLLAVALLACNVHGYFCNDVGLVWPPAE